MDVNQPSTSHAILLVDDAEPVRHRLRRMLAAAAHGGEVVEAGSVSEAIRRFNVLKPGTVVLDLGLPDGNGLEVLHHAKKTDRNCVVVVLTNYTDPETRQHCEKLGADFVFAKYDQFESAIETARQASKREPGRAFRRTDGEVRSVSLMVSSPYGLHVRPAALLVKVAQRFAADVEIVFKGNKANAKSIMGVMVLGAEHGAPVVVTAAGRDAVEALAAIEALFSSNFQEEPATGSPHRNGRAARPA